MQAPVIFAMLPSEKGEHHQMSLCWAAETLRKYIVARGLTPPPRMISQVNGDWTTTLRRKYLRDLHGGDVVTDLGHMYAFLKERKDLSTYRHVLCNYLTIAAFVYHKANFHQLWKIMVPRIEHVWQVGPEFPAYFRKQCLWEKVRQGAGEVFYDGFFWAGYGSKVRPGHPPCQNLAEAFIRICKDVAKKMSNCSKESEFLAELERRCRAACETSGFALSWFGEAQEHRLACAAMDPERSSEDLRRGHGRPVKVFGKIRYHPTLAQIMTAHARRLRGQVLWHFADQDIWVTKTWRGLRGLQKDMRTSMQDATAVAKLWIAGKRKNLAEVDQTWRDVGLVVEKDGMDGVEYPRFTKYFHELCVVGGKPSMRNLQCSCYLYRKTGECAHCLAIYQSRDVVDNLNTMPFGRAPGRPKVKKGDRGRARPGPAPRATLPVAMRRSGAERRLGTKLPAVCRRKARNGAEPASKRKRRHGRHEECRKGQGFQAAAT